MQAVEKERIDIELIRRVIEQDRLAQFQLFELTKKMVYSLAFRIVNDEDVAHDVLQDTYVMVFQEIRNPEQLRNVTQSKADVEHVLH